ncbi:MAG: type II toxin-antitoxin system prevent-host-death family antitoxin, partial [bacterium]
GGERIRIARRGKPIAALVSADDLEMLQRTDDAADCADARKALAGYKRCPASAVPLDDYLRTRKPRA